ncbi:hypothetical protein [Microbacterium sp.]|uniref:hypothetical protein n=1 Tax=Microbacterium sp. TaxID=51671 RepID=UPI00273409EF|nr:hypothetical protein [Microbacterium sp.]MDP3949530.1 hypothetical protein [Microbacterium sp.]
MKSRTGLRTAVAVVAAIAVSIATAGVANASTGVDTAVSYSGEELFEGLLLNHGVLAEEHADVLLDPELAGVVSDEVAGAFLNAVGEEHPEIFDQLETAVESGDPYAVRAALYDGRDVIEALTTETNSAPGEVTPFADTVCSITACGVSFVAVAFFIVWAAVIRPRAAAAFSESAETPSQTLAMDEWVNRIVTTLS